ncbi:MAG: nuclear transport factor 2 family protein [Acidobacteriota bacterium]|nr:nuclear transport factor 2 family protein [Acidobacteriota bacterium]
MSIPPVEVVQRQLDAYNNHDMEAFLATYSPKIRILSFPDSKVMVEGMDQMRERYSVRFAPGSGVHASIINRMVFGDTVIDHERVLGLSEPGVPVEAMAIYHVVDGLIETMWFHVP